MLQIKQSESGWAALQAAMSEMAARPGVRGLMALACESNGPVPSSFDAFLQELAVPVFGGVFPALIADGSRLEQGNIVMGIEVELDVHVVPSLSDATLDYDAELNHAFAPDAVATIHTMFVFVDGLAPRVGALIESLFNTFGLHGNFIGGGAGSLQTPELRCLITAQGVIRDAAVVAIPNLSSRVCVAHGWLPVAGPFEVTHSENNVILSLDWEPALDVYRRAIERRQDQPFDVANFSAIASSHPFGIARLNAEFVVRDPIAIRADGGLVCVGDVPRGALVHIMHGNMNTLLEAARKVRQMVDAITPPAADQGVDIFMDCISRSLFMGETIGKELAAVRHAGRPMIGAFTLGEIANSKHEYLEFHNKTAVVAAIWEANEVT